MLRFRLQHCEVDVQATRQDCAARWQGLNSASCLRQACPLGLLHAQAPFGTWPRKHGRTLHIDSCMGPQQRAHETMTL